MTFFKFFIHQLAFIVRKCLAILLMVVATILVPAVSEWRFLAIREVMLKSYNSRMMLLVKPANQLYRFLPFISDGWIDGRVDFKQSLNLHEGLPKFLAGIVKFFAPISIQSEPVGNKEPNQPGGYSDQRGFTNCKGDIVERKFGFLLKLFALVSGVCSVVVPFWIQDLGKTILRLAAAEPPQRHTC